MAIRVARLRGDSENLVWLALETQTIKDTAARDRVIEELTKYLPRSILRTLHNEAVEAYMVERRLGGGDQLMPLSVAEMEAHIKTIVEMLEVPAEGMTPGQIETVLDSRGQALLRVGELREVLARVRARLHEFLSITEAQLRLGLAVSGVFERYRTEVDLRLQEIAPEATAQLLTAYRRRAEDDPEARTHALTSCRRALKTVADAVYPSRAEPVLCADGLERVLGDDKYINRLLQYVAEQAGGHTATDLLLAQIDHLGTRLTAINDLASKGVHDAVTDHEVDQCVIQTYLVLGDILRLRIADSTPQPLA